MKADSDEDRISKRDEFIKRLKSDREWFKSRRIQIQGLWLSLTLVSLMFGFVTSILIAMGWPNATEQPGKAILVALPAISSFCGTILAQFRLRENWELREFGRIDVDEAIVRASFLPIDDPVAFSKGLYDLQMARVQLSRLQTTRFFATLTEKPAETQKERPQQKS
jgi:hypothetical protein